MLRPATSPQDECARRLQTIVLAALISTLVTPLCAQTTSTAADDVTLERIQNVVSESLDQLPNHTCRLEIRRAHLGADTRNKLMKRAEKSRAQLRAKIEKQAEDRRKGRLVPLTLEEEHRALEEEGQLDIDIPLDVADAISLEVVVVEGRELYAFPDSPRFESISLAELVGHGTIATGAFAGHAQRILVDRVGAIRYVGEEELNGQHAQRYDYTVLLADSRYSVTNLGLSTRVPYHGSFWAATENDKLLRLTVRVDELPRDVGVNRFATRIDYQTVTMGSKRLLLPQRSQFTMLLSTGVESISETQFTNCRSFVGSSTLSFDDSTARFYVEKTEVIENLKVPPGLLLPIELTTGIDSKNSRIGDRIEAELTDDVHFGADSVLPKGALLRGRLRRLDSYEGLNSYHAVGIEFQELLFGTSRAVVALSLEQVAYNRMGARTELPPAWSERQVGNLNQSSVYGERNAPIVTEESTDRFVGHELFGVVVIYVLPPVVQSTLSPGPLHASYRGNKNDTFKLIRGLQMSWRTVSLASVSE